MHGADTRAPFCGFFGPTCGLWSPSWRHLGTILRHPRAILGHLGAISRSSWVYLAPSQCYDFGRRTMYSRFRKMCTSLTREHDFFVFLGATCGLLSPSGRHLETVLRHPQAILGRLGTISARLGPSWRHFGPSRRADRRRQSSFGKIRTSPTREHHFVVASRPSLIQYWGCHASPKCKIGVPREHFEQ